MSTAVKVIGSGLIGLIVGAGGGYYLAKTEMTKQIAAAKKAQTPKWVQEATPLVSRSMEVFAESIQKGTMEPFYNEISDFWRKKTSVAKLDKTFQGFIKAKVDLRPLKKMQPVFTRPPVKLKNGDIVLMGFYPTKPSRVYFRQTFRQENGKWKLTAFFVEIKK